MTGILPQKKNNKQTKRQTWLSSPRVNQHKVAHKFFIGISYKQSMKYNQNNHIKDEKDHDYDSHNNNNHVDHVDDINQDKQEKRLDDLYKPLMSEVLAYGDIGLLNLEDHYLSTPKKVISLFKWGVEKCGAYYILRSNDDVYIRLDETITRLTAKKEGLIPSNIMMGLYIYGNTMTVPRPETYKSTQEQLYEKYKVWAFTLSDYPTETFPNFLQGNGLILSRDFAQELSNKAKEPWFRLMADDIMIALILQHKISQNHQNTNIISDFQIDYEFEGLYTLCHNDAMWHFNIHPEHMYDLYHNQLLGNSPCDGIIRFCCG